MHIEIDMEDLTQEEKLSIKYKYIREKMIEHYNRGCKYLKIAKIIIAVLFVLYTVLCCVFGRTSGDIMGWLVQWVILIFINVFLFLVLDYVKYLVEDKLIPYLKNDDQLEYGEYDIFVDRDDLLEFEEEEEE